MTDVQQAAKALREEWDAALATKVEMEDTEDWPAAYRWEQDAYDRLIDFVEANGLNYSEFDPRGPEDDPQ
ncbi:MAG TPA: hypothetical protein VIT65_10740 [Microlunatus sp.]